MLKFHDRDKLRGDEIHLSWTDESLLELILLRANASLNGNLKKPQFWSNYFVPNVQGVPTTKYLIDRTLKRPRDIIQFCNLCRDNATVNNNKKIQENDILQATDVYSSWKINDLIAEWKVNYPFLNDLFILFSNSSYLIPRARFQNLFNKIKPTFLSRYPEFSNNLSEDGILNILYSIGFIGIERFNNVSYYYDDPKTVEFVDNLFVVHPSFRNALKCLSSINIQRFEGIGEEERYYSEFQRSRGASRFVIENVRSSRNFFGRFLFNLTNFLDIIRNDNLPGEIITEITDNVKTIQNQIYIIVESQDIVSFEVVRRSSIKFFDNLYKRLVESEFVDKNSELKFAIEKLKSELRRASFEDLDDSRYLK